MAEEKDKKEIRQIAKGKKTERSLAEKAGDLFLSEDTRTVKNYIFHEVLIPGLKTAFADVIIGGIEMALFGSSRGRRSSRGGETRVSYNGYYDRGSYGGSSSRMDRSGRPDKYDFGSIMLDSRGEAEEVVYAMEELVRKYDEATVADLNSLVGITSRHTDIKWGWTDVRDFNYRRSGRGYVLDFNQPTYLG